MEKIKCEKCETMTPRNQIDKAMIYSREFVGEMEICDICYVDINGNQIRKRLLTVIKQESYLNPVLWIILLILLGAFFIGLCIGYST